MTTGASLLRRIDEGAVTRKTVLGQLGTLSGAPIRAAPRSRYNHACSVWSTEPELSLILIGDDSVRTGSPWAVQDPVLRKLRQGEAGAAFRAAVRRGGQEVGWPLARLDAIGLRNAELLGRAGIDTATSLIRAAAPKEARARLAKSPGLNALQLQEWVLLAELSETLRVAPEVTDPARKGRDVWPGYVLDLTNLLALAGIISTGVLIERTQIPPTSSGHATGPDTKRIDTLAKLLTTVNRAETIVLGVRSMDPKYTVTSASVREWVLAARAAPSSRLEPEQPAHDGANGGTVDS